MCVFPVTLRVLYLGLRHHTVPRRDVISLTVVCWWSADFNHRVSVQTRRFLPQGAKGRLDLEASDTQVLEDGGKTTNTKKPMASVTYTGTKTPAPSPIACKSLFERSRNDTSLVFLTRRFADLLMGSTDGVLDLNVVSQQLNAPKRRVYDVTNVLEGIQLIKKKSKNCIEWLGGELKVHAGQELENLIEEERRLDELIQNCTHQFRQMCEDRHSQRFAYLTYDDVQNIPSLKEQTVIVIKAPAETKLEVPHPEESLQVYLSSTQGPIEVFLCSDEPVPMDATDGCHLNTTTSSDDSAKSLPYPSFVQVSSKDDDTHTSRNKISSLLTKPTQQSSAVKVTPMSRVHTSLTSLQHPSEDQQSFVTLTPPVAFSLDGEEYVLNLAEDEGITDLFSSVDMDHLPLDMPLL